MRQSLSQIPSSFAQIKEIIKLLPQFVGTGAIVLREESPEKIEVEVLLKIGYTEHMYRIAFQSHGLAEITEVLCDAFMETSRPWSHAINRLAASFGETLNQQKEALEVELAGMRGCEEFGERTYAQTLEKQLEQLHRISQIFQHGKENAA